MLKPAVAGCPLLQVELASWFLRDATDRHLQQVTVTEVRMSPDLRLARVYYRTLEGAQAEAETQRALGRVTPYLRRVLGRVLALRVVPDLRFEYDVTLDKARRLDELLRTGRDPSDDEKNR